MTATPDPRSSHAYTGLAWCSAGVLVWKSMCHAWGVLLRSAHHSLLLGKAVLLGPSLELAAVGGSGAAGVHKVGWRLCSWVDIGCWKCLCKCCRVSRNGPNPTLTMMIRDSERNMIALS